VALLGAHAFSASAVDAAVTAAFSALRYSICAPAYEQPGLA